MAEENKDDVKLIEKALRIGLGLISLGEEKLGSAVEELSKRGEEYAERDDSAVSRLLSALAEKGETITGKGNNLKDRLAEGIKGIPGKVSFATKADLEKLKAELYELKSRLEQDSGA